MTELPAHWRRNSLAGHHQFEALRSHEPDAVDRKAGTETYITSVAEILSNAQETPLGRVMFKNAAAVRLALTRLEAVGLVARRQREQRGTFQLTLYVGERDARRRAWERRVA